MNLTIEEQIELLSKVCYSKYTLTHEQIEFINKVCDSRWTLNSDSKVDIEGKVDMTNMKLTEIPVKFGRVGGYFDCSFNNLTTLKNCPDYISGSFYVHRNHLTSLEFAPTQIGLSFWIRENNLTDYFKTIKGKDFLYWNNLISSIDDVLEEYPFLINSLKMVLDPEKLKFILNEFPLTKLYLE